MPNETTQLLPINGAPILFYNVENLFDTENDLSNPGDDEFLPYGEMRWDDERYQDKLNKLCEAMLMANAKAPLIAGFAEIENHEVLEDLAKNKAWKGTKYKIIQYDSEDSRGIDVGLIYDSEKFHPLKSDKIEIRIKEEPEFRTRDILYVHGVLNNKKEIHIFVNHWSSRREGQLETEYRRIEAASTLRQQIDQIQKQDQYANIIVMGDFNDTPTDRSMKQVLKAKSPEEKTNASELINLMYDKELEGEGTIKFRNDWMIFDQLMISRPLFRGSHGLKIQNNEGLIVKNDLLLYHYQDGESKPNSTYGGENYYGGYSDHLPVFLVLEAID